MISLQALSGCANPLVSSADEWPIFRDHSLPIADTSCISVSNSQQCKAQCATEISCRAFDYTVSSGQCCLKQFAWGENGFYDSLLSTPGTDHYSQHCPISKIPHITFIMPQWPMQFEIILGISDYVSRTQKTSPCIHECCFYPSVRDMTTTYILAMNWWCTYVCEYTLNTSSSKVTDMNQYQWFGGKSTI